MPIFDIYCADSLKPKIDALSFYDVPDDAHKEMPIENIVNMFHQEFVVLWNKTIISNYECDSVFEWLKHWLFIRKEIINLFNKSYICICKILEGRALGDTALEVDQIRSTINTNLSKVYKYPNEERPFGDKIETIQGFHIIESKYFQSIINFCNQFVGFLTREKSENHLALANLRIAKGNLLYMQNFFYRICEDQGLFMEDQKKLCVMEINNIDKLIVACMFYNNHAPSKYFDKYSMQKWYNTQENTLLEQTQKALNNLSESYKVIFPHKIFWDELLRYYPIMIYNIDLSDSETLLHIISLCYPIQKFEYDYLTIIPCNEHNEVVENTFRISIKSSPL